MPRVIHFEIHADSPDRAIQFYREIRGCEFTKWEGPPGINGGLIPRRCPIDGQAVIAYVCTVDTPSVDQYVAKAQACGGSVALPKMPIPGLGWLAYCKDTEGNIFGLMEADPKAG